MCSQKQPTAFKLAGFSTTTKKSVDYHIFSTLFLKPILTASAWLVIMGTTTGKHQYYVSLLRSFFEAIHSKTSYIKKRITDSGNQTTFIFLSLQLYFFPIYTFLTQQGSLLIMLSSSLYSVRFDGRFSLLFRFVNESLAGLKCCSQVQC